MAIFPRPTYTPEDRAADEANLVRTEWAQPAIGATSAAMLAMLGACGLVANMTAGHSFGELTALWASGALSFDDWMKAARRRGLLMAGASDIPGAMAAVTAAADLVAPHLAEGVGIANYNAPEQTVIAGTVEAVDAQGRFLGGLILPGHGIMLRALESGTAGLRVPTGEVQPFPTNTSDALTSGGTFAIAGAIERMVQHARAHCQADPVCYMTGGAGWKMAPSMSVPFELVDSLLFDGLLEIALQRGLNQFHMS
jgi:hypothetical protein